MVVIHFGSWTCQTQSCPTAFILALSFNCDALAQLLSHVWQFATPRTKTCQSPLSMGFSRQEYWNGLPCPPPGDLPDSGIKSASPMSPEPPGNIHPQILAWLTAHHSRISSSEWAFWILLWSPLVTCKPITFIFFFALFLSVIICSQIFVYSPSLWEQRPYPSCLQLYSQGLVIIVECMNKQLGKELWKTCDVNQSNCMEGMRNGATQPKGNTQYHCSLSHIHKDTKSKEAHSHGRWHNVCNIMRLFWKIRVKCFVLAKLSILTNFASDGKKVFRKEYLFLNSYQATIWDLSDLDMKRRYRRLRGTWHSWAAREGLCLCSWMT